MRKIVFVQYLLEIRRNMSQKLVYPACERNKVPILEVLKLYLPKDRNANVLEISSGSGQHVSFFAKNFPNLTFQPSEFDTKLFSSIRAYISGVKNVKEPLQVDVQMDVNQWNLDTMYEYVLNINMLHITRSNCTKGLFANVAKILPSGGLLITYGPYANNGIIEPQSNIDFDQYLKETDSDWGLRDIKELEVIGKLCNLQLQKIHDMPSNNKCLVWQRV